MALNPEQVAKLRLALQGGGWKDVMEPAIANRAHQAIRALVLSPSERSGEFKEMEDSQIRARIQEAEWMLTVWKNEITVFDLNRANDELARQRSQEGSEPDPTANP